MRLIDVKTRELKEFYHNIPPYAILSHTWEDEEVTFQEYLLCTDPSLTSSIHAHISAIKKKTGFIKIDGACRCAQVDGLGYLWCDTNCIDKNSSAELTEAINSMYAWYRDSVVCYAYLFDVGAFNEAGRGAEKFRKSRWFKRGWTLQELLAPEKVVFYNGNWGRIGDRQQLAEIISEGTRIHIGALLDRNTVHGYSIAQRMSWAAGRQTSRQEDIAYCLLGIFGINIPLLYGEGLEAFTRLQEEIIKKSDDQSILAWDFLDGQQVSPSGILASSPNEFASCGSIIRRISSRGSRRWPYSMTNLGISLELPTIRTHIRGHILVELNCSAVLDGYASRANMEGGWHRSRYPVWIWLRSIHNKIYTRSFAPDSRTYLTVLYPDTVNCAATRFYGTTTAPSNGALVSGAHSSSGNSSTGFHVTLSFGRILPLTGTFEEGFLPGHYSVQKLSPRGWPALSHEIISAGNYIVLLSIAWNREKQPEHWCHETFGSINGTTMGVMSANNWDVLFPNEPLSSARTNSSVGRIKYIHDQIRRLSDQPIAPTPDNTLWPFVEIERSLRQDLHRKVKVVVHLTFQEATKPHVH